MYRAVALVSARQLVKSQLTSSELRPRNNIADRQPPANSSTSHVDDIGDGVRYRLRKMDGVVLGFGSGQNRRRQ